MKKDAPLRKKFETDATYFDDFWSTFNTAIEVYPIFDGTGSVDYTQWPTETVP